MGNDDIKKISLQFRQSKIDVYDINHWIFADIIHILSSLQIIECRACDKHGGKVYFIPNAVIEIKNIMDENKFIHLTGENFNVIAIEILEIPHFLTEINKVLPNALINTFLTWFENTFNDAILEADSNGTWGPVFS